MKKTLPARPNLDHLKTQAKDLLDAFRAGVIANLPVSVDDKARYASEPNLVARLEWVLALFDRAA